MNPAVEVLLYKPAYGAIVAILLAWILGRIGWSFLWALVIVPALLKWAEVIHHRVIRKKLQEYDLLQKSKLNPTHESVEWINNIIAKVYQNYDKFIAALVLEKVNPILKENKPGFLQEIGLRDVSIGKNPPRVSNFCVNPSKPAELSIDLDVDLKMDISMVVFAKAAVTAPVSVEDLEFHAKIRAWVLLVPQQEPFAKLLRVQILEPPKDFDIEVRPMNTVDMLEIPGLKQWIHSIVVDQTNDMLLHPKYLEIDLAPDFQWPPEDLDVDGLDGEKKKEGMISGGLSKAGDIMSGGLSMVGSGVGAVGGGAMKAGGAVVGGVGKAGGAVVGGVGKAGGAVVGGVGKAGGAVYDGVGKGMDMVTPSFLKKSSSKASVDGDKESTSSSSGLFKFGKKDKKSKKGSPDDSSESINDTADDKAESAADAPLSARVAEDAGEVGGDVERSESTEVTEDDVSQASDDDVPDDKGAEKGEEKSSFMNPMNLLGSGKKEKKKHSSKSDKEKKEKKEKKERKLGLF